MTQPRPLYNETHQTRQSSPTLFENLLGDALERAFAAGIHDLDALVAQLNVTGPRAPQGELWSRDSLQAMLAQLGQ
jgi:hypothetical protein